MPIKFGQSAQSFLGRYDVVLSTAGCGYFSSFYVGELYALTMGLIGRPVFVYFREFEKFCASARFFSEDELISNIGVYF